MKRLVVSLIICLALLTACNTAIEDKEEVPAEVVVEPEEVEEPERILSYLSGLEIEEEFLSQRPMAIMYDNHPDARWQCNLKEAELIYEIPVEGTFTRYMGLFLINEPNLIGSVRSARPYFVELAHEYGAVYVHAGGSEDAKAACRSMNVVDMDAIIASPQEFWRVDHKKAPHNLYTSTEAIRNFEKNSSKQVDFPTENDRFLFDEGAKLLSKELQKLIIKYFSDNVTVYEYNKETNDYSRYKDGKEHVDESDENPLMAKNIIIQKTNSRVLDSEGRLAVTMVGSGEGYLFRDGTFEEILWERPTLSDITRYTYKDGKPIVLKPGITWIQVTDQLTQILKSEEPYESISPDNES
ncbi:MAG: DUF3048 domain-containing protein [Tissierellia bacterium]|nr:DUF3048 domain-containing protein [Tissierellia bacterium]